MPVLKQITTIIADCGPHEQIFITLKDPVDLRPIQTTSGGPITLQRAAVGTLDTELTITESPGTTTVILGDCCPPQDSTSTLIFDSAVHVFRVGGLLIFTINP